MDILSAARNSVPHFMLFSFLRSVLSYMDVLLHHKSPHRNNIN